MVGRLPDARDCARLGFAREGDEIALVGPFAPSLPASELAKLRGEALPDGLPEIDIAAVVAAHEAVRESVRAGRVSSAHDIAEGGIAVALAECCLAGGLGAAVELSTSGTAEEGLFGEAPGGFLLSGDAAAITALCGGGAGRRIGIVGGDALTIEVPGGEAREALSWSLEELSSAHSEGLAAFFA
jgi:phosphoribosylformylglycinamidine synthase